MAVEAFSSPYTAVCKVLQQFESLTLDLRSKRRHCAQSKEVSSWSVCRGSTDCVLRCLLLAHHAQRAAMGCVETLEWELWPWCEAPVKLLAGMFETLWSKHEEARKRHSECCGLCMWYCFMLKLMIWSLASGVIMLPIALLHPTILIILVIHLPIISVAFAFDSLTFVLISLPPLLHVQTSFLGLKVLGALWNAGLAIGASIADAFTLTKWEILKRSAGYQIDFSPPPFKVPKEEGSQP
eukprot:4726818-Amphidinium_carterae.1